MCSGIFLHDPVSFVALVRPDLFTYKSGVVRVETQGICVGHTLMDQGIKKYVQSYTWFYRIFLQFSNCSVNNPFPFSPLISCRWNSSNPWTGYSPISVAWTVKVDEVTNYVKDLLRKPWVLNNVVFTSKTVFVCWSFFFSFLNSHFQIVE